MTQKVEQVKVIGTGGIGHCLLPVLCRVLNFGASLDEYSFDEGVEVHLIDGDDYEERNRDRQGFNRRGNKAEVTADEYREEFPNLEIQSHPMYINDENAPMLIRNGDVVFLCVDNHKTRKMVSDFCQELDDVTVISGGNDLEDGNVMIYVKEDGKDVTLPFTAVHPAIANPDDEHPDEVDRTGGCDEQVESAPQLLIANNAAADHMLRMFHGWLKGNYSEVKQVMQIGKGKKVKELPNQKYHNEVFFDIDSGSASARWTQSGH